MQAPPCGPDPSWTPSALLLLSDRPTPLAQVVEGGELVVVPSAEGGATTPSVVAFQEGGGAVLVGEAALR